jgi:hypothetical protein
LRIFKRVEVEIEVNYQSIKYHNWYSTVTKGIGTGGICLLSKEYLGIGTIIKIRMPLSSLTTSIEVTGEVLWSDFLIDRKLYESGIKFENLEDIEKVLISEFIDDFIYNQKGKIKI